MIHVPEDLVAASGSLDRLPEDWHATFPQESKFRGKQIFEWIWKKGELNPERMTNLSLPLRQTLGEMFEDVRKNNITQVHTSEDTTQKILIELHDTFKVETVLLPRSVSKRDGQEEPEEAGEQEGPEQTLLSTTQYAHTAPEPISQCISTQVGCAMGCGFCASGIAGLKRNMNSHEILLQIALGRAHWPAGTMLRNIVLMGMGEPLHNYDAVARALTVMCHPEGMGLSSRRVTLSTSGLVPEIDKLGRDFNGQVQLAVSLHAPDNERRSQIMPINRKYPLEALMAALKRYPLPKRRRITMEYTLIAGFNDSIKDAHKLVRLLEEVPCKINLIPLNRVQDVPLGAPEDDTVSRFHEELLRLGVATFVRKRKGDDIAAACGQLALFGEKRKVKPQLPVL